MGLLLTRVLLSLLCEEHSGKSYSTKLPLLEGLEWFFGSGGPLKDSTFDLLEVFAAKVFSRYLCSAAHDAAHGVERADAVYGPPVAPSENDTPGEATTSLAEGGKFNTLKLAIVPC